MLENNKYDLSFTASSLRINEMVTVAVHLKNGERQDVDVINQIGNGKITTGKRIFRECKKRLAQLTEKEKTVLIEGDLTIQKQMGFLAIGKLHGFIRDFSIEVLREKLLLFDYSFTEGDYISFYNRKTETNPELDSFTENTQKKIKQITFKILEQVGLIDSVKTKNIQPQILDDKVKRIIADDDPQWLKMFLLSDSEIAEINI